MSPHSARMSGQETLSFRLHGSELEDWMTWSRLSVPVGKCCTFMGHGLVMGSALSSFLLQNQV